MHAYEFRNADEALPEMIRAVQRLGVRRESRNGPVLQFPKPVAIRYERPTERVVFHALRDANPFFHFAESLWMLAGRDDVAFPSLFVKNFGRYSDDGVTFNGAYGYRWRHHFGVDQIATVIQALRSNPDDRRHVITMFDGCYDLGLQSADIPCNLTATVQVNPHGALDLTVYNRSNDLIWGALGANAVHFSFLQEYIAIALGVPVGASEQVSSNMHAYLDTLEKVAGLEDLTRPPRGYSGLSPYAKDRELEPLPMNWGSHVKDFTEEDWWNDLNIILDEGAVMGLKVPWLRKVACPILDAHRHYRENDSLNRYDGAVMIVQGCQSPDWRLACTQWLQRRKTAVLRKNQGSEVTDV
jgi:hypothetical protein